MRVARRRHRGQGMVEFAMVFPFVMTLCFGLISSAWLFWQGSSISDGAKGGVRAATILNIVGLTPAPGTGSSPLDFIPLNGGDPCSLKGWGLGGESQQPYPVEAVVAHDADQVPINNLPLCAGPAVEDDQWGGTITKAMALAYNAQPPTNCGGGHPPIQLSQRNADPNQGEIFVDPPAVAGLPANLCSGTVGNLTVVVVRQTKGLAPPFNTVFRLSAHSTLPCYPKQCG